MQKDIINSSGASFVYKITTDSWVYCMIYESMLKYDTTLAREAKKRSICVCNKLLSRIE